jgi:FkbM family methyltransferase
MHRWTIISVEANPFFKEMLLAERAFVEMCAVADEPKDKAEFFVHEQNPESYSALKVDTRGRQNGATWVRYEVPVRTVDQILEKWDFPSLDVMAVDVEGGELEVFKGTDLNRWKPKVIVSEAWEPGSSYPYLSQFGYKLVARNVDNDLYLHNG